MALQNNVFLAGRYSDSIPISRSWINSAYSLLNRNMKLEFFFKK